MIPQVRLFKGIVSIFQASLGKTYYEELTNGFDGSLIAENGLSVVEANALLIRLADSALGASVLGATPNEVAAQLTRNFGLNPDQTATDVISREAFNFFLAGLQRGESAGTLVVAAINFLEEQQPDSLFYDVALLLENRSRVAEHHSMVLEGTSTLLPELQAVLAGVTADPASVFARIGELNALIEGQSTVNGTGTPGRDDIDGSANTSDRLSLGDGADSFEEDADVLFGIGPTPDGRRLSLGTSFNQVDLGDGADRGVGGYGVDILLGGPGNDTLVGEESGSFLAGLTAFQQRYFGQDFLLGGEGDDRLAGRFGDDLILGGSGDDSISGDEGNDRLEGGDGNDRIEGNLGNDILLGGAGNDFLDGGAPRFGSSETGPEDFLDGGDGADTLIVTARDRAFGGNGGDLIMITTSTNPTNQAFVMPGNGADMVVLDGINGQSDVTVDFSESIRSRDILDLTAVLDGLSGTSNATENSFVFRGFAPGEDGLRVAPMTLNGSPTQTSTRGKVIDSNGMVVSDASQTLDSVGETLDAGKAFFLVNFQKISANQVLNGAASLIDQLGANHSFDKDAKHLFAIEIEDQGLGLFVYENFASGTSSEVSSGLNLSLLGVLEGVSAASAASQDLFAV